MFDYYNNLLINIALSYHLYWKFILDVIVEQELLTIPVDNCLMPSEQ
jgi:hypothetical protein